VGDLQRILAGPKKKKKKSKYDSDSDADVDDDEQSVMRRNNEFAERSWTQKLKETDDQGWTALHWAASKGHTEVVRELLEADRRGGGEEGEGEDEFGGAAGGGAPLIDLPELLFEWTPLFLACIELHVDTVEELLSAGADANLTDSLGDRPLEACAKSRAGRRKDAIRKMLKKHMDDDGLSSDSDDEEEEEEEEEEESSSGSSEGEASWAGSDSSDDSSSDDDDGRRKRR
jgi:ankyrin repeat protein